MRVTTLLCAIAILIEFIEELHSTENTRMSKFPMGTVHCGLFLVCIGIFTTKPITSLPHFAINLGNILFNYYNITTIDSIYQYSFSSICSICISIGGMLLILFQLVTVITYEGNYEPTKTSLRGTHSSIHLLTHMFTYSLTRYCIYFT